MISIGKIFNDAVELCYFRRSLVKTYKQFDMMYKADLKYKLKGGKRQKSNIKSYRTRIKLDPKIKTNYNLIPRGCDPFGYQQESRLLGEPI